MMKPAQHVRMVAASTIEQAMRLQPLDTLARYLDGGSMAAFDSMFIRSTELYEQIKSAADYGSDRIDGREIFYFHRRRRYRQRRYEFAFKFYAHDGEIHSDAIEVCWCEIPLEEFLQRCSATASQGLQKYSVYLYDDEHLHLGSVLFANGRSLDFAASEDGERFIVVMLYGTSDEDERRAADVRSRMVALGRTRHAHSRVQRLTSFVDNR